MAFFKIICFSLISVFMLQAAAPAVYAETKAEGEFPENKGTFEENGLTMIEFTANSYLDSSYTTFLEKIEDWPSEKLLQGAAETDLKKWLTVDKAVHLATDASKWMDSDKKKKENYRSIIISLFVEKDDLYNDSDYSSFTKYVGSDSKVFNDISRYVDYETQLGEDTAVKDKVKDILQEYLSEDADINWPVISVVNDILSATNDVEDAIELCYAYKALYKKSEEYKTIVAKMKEETDDLILFAALDEVDNVMDDLPSAFSQALTEGVIDIGLWGAKKVVREAYNGAVLSALPTELRLALQIGTFAGDAVTSFLFANGAMENNLHMLECIGELGRVLLKTTEKLGQQYDSDRKSGANVTSEKKQTDAAAYVNSVYALFDLYYLSCDYSQKFVKSSLDETWFEKLILFFDVKKNAEYKDTLSKLVSYKQKALEQEKQMIVNSLYDMKVYYPDAYASERIEDLSVEDYIDKVYDDYDKKISKVKDAYTDDDSDKMAALTADDSAKYVSPKELIDDFLYSDGPAYDRQGKTIYFKDLQDETKTMGVVYQVGPRADFDNDGEEELYLTGSFYGGMMLDAKDGKLSVFEEGFGTAGVLGYGYYDGKWVICHKDTSHTGRNIYSFTVYDGADEVAETFDLAAEYWESDDPNGYDDNSTFTFKGETITRKEYESLLREIFAKGDPSYATIRMLPKARPETEEESENAGKTLADIVAEYEAKYGKLEFKTGAAGSKYYTGVFLLEQIDFDRDAKYELVIGYATEIADAHISSPKLDVWQMKNGVPVKAYEGACITHGDIGSRCAFLNYTSGRPELIVGSDGFETDLKFLTFNNGTFSETGSLKYEFTGTDYVWSINGEAVSESKGMERMNELRSNKDTYYGTLSSDLGQSEKSIREALEEAKKKLGV